MDPVPDQAPVHIAADREDPRLRRTRPPGRRQQRGPPRTAATARRRRVDPHHPPWHRPRGHLLRHRLAWLLAQGDDIAPIPGTKRVSRLEENMAADAHRLSADQLAALGAPVGDRFSDMSPVNR
ncbi:hypothetical protein E3O48_11590 [Cryobacterium sp. HLT2-28]|nr:hypothetical protein E3O48_11590 [Cryobacterium sp. HLT2-28]